MRKRLSLFSLSALVAMTSLAAAPIWRAQCEMVYEPSETDQTKLVYDYTSRITYNTDGKMTQEVVTDISGGVNRLQLTYNDAGRVIKQESATFSRGQWTTTRVIERTYDEITGAITSNTETSYDNGKPNAGNCYRTNITRNEAGNITEVEVAVLYQGKYDPTRRLLMTYKEGTDSVSEILCKQLTTSNGTSFYWIDGEHYTDCVWHETNGQIVDITDLYRGANRLKSAHYVNKNNGRDYNDFNISATYVDGTPGFTSVWSGLYQGFQNAEITREYSETAQPDGTTRYELHTCYSSPGGDPENYLNLNIIDAYGNIVEDSQTYWTTDPDDVEVESLVKSQIEYDPAYGYPLSVVTNDNGLDISRVEFSEYIDCSTIGALNNVVAPLTAPGAELFDLQGRKVARPGRGLYVSPAGKVFLTR